MPRLAPASLVLSSLLACGCASAPAPEDPRAATDVVAHTLLIPRGEGAALEQIGTQLEHPEPYQARLLTAEQVQAVLARALPPGALGVEQVSGVRSWPTGGIVMSVHQQIGSEAIHPQLEHLAMTSTVLGFVGTRWSEGRVELRIASEGSLSLQHPGLVSGEDVPPPRTWIEGELRFEGPKPAPGGGLLFFARTGKLTPLHAALFVSGP